MRVFHKPAVRAGLRHWSFAHLLKLPLQVLNLRTLLSNSELQLINVLARLVYGGYDAVVLIGYACISPEIIELGRKSRSGRRAISPLPVRGSSRNENQPGPSQCDKSTGFHAILSVNIPTAKSPLILAAKAALQQQVLLQPSWFTSSQEALVV